MGTWRVKHLRNRRFWQTILAAMLIPLALIAFWPTPVDRPVQGLLADTLSFLHRHGIPGWFNYQFVETTANVMLFVPVGFVSALSFPEKRWWQITALGLLVSGCIELGQLLFLHDRFASRLDLATNTAGAAAGAWLAFLAIKRLEARHLAAADLQ
ncbi:VanZ family protein [Pseudarthrobacter chlorophenolicus A6]|uniref:VanZ family protein n=1 Tax=Pseudarthrobacter chlorophenolicus (strain ATCC 700700 / DSM 12829 / CIP 107037 / JCM 12360 / KCTC 9906 / NCIMB 13794 / A6) TaxID=452863 RepID=B8HEG8_PSECP|nr:VanZ family protein [Pseudarthrobacter chlorophenolicus]ACL40913.1 VanZ family protein [Pseudarthrobacter chlorophenolicus A6]SDQ73007.1 VanZ like family protein [Pseudarthrobacter chlorophenolicus]